MRKPIQWVEVARENGLKVKVLTLSSLPKGLIGIRPDLFIIDDIIDTPKNEPGTRMNQVTVYSAEWCKHCGPYKDRLKAIGIPFTEVDMDDEDATKKTFGLGIRSLPTTVVTDPE